MSHMSLEFDPMPVLLARLREVADISHINHLEGGGLSRPNKVVPANTPSLESQIETLRHSVQTGQNERETMEKKIKSMTVQLEKTEDDNRKVHLLLKTATERVTVLEKKALDDESTLKIRRLALKTSDDQISNLQKNLDLANVEKHRLKHEKNKLETGLKNAEDRVTQLTFAVQNANSRVAESQKHGLEREKLETDLKDRVRDLEAELKESVVKKQDAIQSKELALAKVLKSYQALVHADNKMKELEVRLTNADYEVKNLKGFQKKADYTHEDFKRQVLRSGDSDKKEWANALERIRKSDDKIKEMEEENLNLLLSLKRAQEIIVSVSTFIKIIGDPGHPIQYPPPVENARDANTRNSINPSEKKNLLVERFRRLNDGLVQSRICDYPIYMEFITTFQAAINELCVPSLLIKGGACELYKMYAEKDFISDNAIPNVKRLTLAAFAILHTIVPRKPPRLDNFKDFNLQIYREFENILCIFEGIEQNRTLHVNDIPGYGVHVFWEQTRQEIELAKTAMKAVG